MAVPQRNHSVFKYTRRTHWPRSSEAWGQGWGRMEHACVPALLWQNKGVKVVKVIKTCDKFLQILMIFKKKNLNSYKIFKFQTFYTLRVLIQIRMKPSFPKNTTFNPVWSAKKNVTLLKSPDIMRVTLPLLEPEQALFTAAPVFISVSMELKGKLEVKLLKKNKIKVLVGHFKKMERCFFRLCPCWSGDVRHKISLKEISGSTLKEMVPPVARVWLQLHQRMKDVDGGAKEKLKQAELYRLGLFDLHLFDKGSLTKAVNASLFSSYIKNQQML